MRFLFQSVYVFFLLMGIFSCGSENHEQEQHKAQEPITSVKKAKVDSHGKFIVDLSISKKSADVEKAQKIDQLLERLHKTAKFNTAVLVGERGKIIYAKGWGYTNFQKKTPLTVHSSFHLASVSKQFTAMAVMMLNDENKLSYDDDIKKYIPEIPYDGVTIRHLLTHTSGIPNILNYIPNYMSFWDSCAIAKNEDVVYMLDKHKPRLSFKPGNRFSYNNTGYVLLAVIVERVSKIPFEEFIEQNIFQPLGMNDSKIYSIVKEPTLRERVFGYGQRRNFFSLDEDDIRNGLTGEKGVYSSVMDLYKWDQALYTDFLVKDSTLNEAFQRAVLNNGKEVNYGFGWRRAKKNDQIIYHFGHWRGFNTCIMRFTKDQKVIIILNNTGSRRIKHLAEEIIDIIYPDESIRPEFD